MTDSPPLEIWGGFECSFVRVGNDIRNQVVDTGHSERLGDLDLVASLGIRTLRYPILWETVCGAQDNEDWRWHDLRLARLRELGVSPIAGLVHHGSGPAHCDVLNPDFPEALGCYAAAVVRRYPWLDLFTPINEPMTTARLCGLYGHWHPHGRDEATCFHVVVAECRAIVSAMKAARSVNPGAQLIQTEDIGRVFATPELQYQADHENERRWLALDLLAGKVDHGHPFHQRLLECGIRERHLAELADGPCLPDIIGIDQYLTSDRFLDHRVERHPGEQPGGNSQHVYVDVAAVRSAVSEDKTGFLPRIREAWDRYRRPIALTEVHNGCTREEQLRWLMDSWKAATTARVGGIDLRAVTVWSLFGATDWNSLLTRREGYYEPGAFDCRFDPPRPTVIARAVTELSRSASFTHPALSRAGWWKAEDACEPASLPILLLGGGGITALIAESCAARRLDVQAQGSDFDRTGSEAGGWAVVEAESGFRAVRRRSAEARLLRLTCDYVTNSGLPERLVVEAAHLLDPVCVVNAFLDLVIDGSRGYLRLTRANPSGQYEFVAVNHVGQDNLAPVRAAV